MCKSFTQLLFGFFIIYHTALFTSSMITKEFLARITYGNDVAAFLSMCLVLLLFTGSFTAISITFSKVFAHSTSTTNSSITNKEISPQVKNFILNQIVHKSRAAIVIGFVDPNGTKIVSLEICQYLIIYL